MSKINLIIAKRYRDNYLKLSLHNFNLANLDQKHDISVYIGEDIKENINKLDYSIYKNLKIEHIYAPNLAEAQGLFCRGHILNVLMQKMRRDYDFVCVIDTDIVYKDDFFDNLTRILKSGNSMETCIIAKGFYTEPGTNYEKIIQGKLGYDAIIKQTSHTYWERSHSQISLTRAYHEHIKKVLGVQSVFDAGGLGENFIGYGWEDYLVEKIMLFSKLKVVTLPYAWVHIWHERVDGDRERIKLNKYINQSLQKVAIKKLKAASFYESPLLKKIKSMFTHKESYTLPSQP